MYKLTQISPTSEDMPAYRPTSRPFSARNCRREKQLLGKRTFRKFFAFFAFFFNLLLFCAHHAGTNQAPKATVSTYRKHKRTAFNRPCTAQQSSYGSTFVSTRVRQRKQAGMKEQAQSCREPFLYEYFMFLLSSLNVVSSLSTRKANKKVILIFFQRYR